MRILHVTALLVLTAVSACASAQTASTAEPTPAQLRIEAAQKQLQANPQKLQALNELAMAYLRRARETADPKYLQEAEEALSRGLKLDSDDFQLLKTQASLLIASHDYAQAMVKAKALNHRSLDDVMTYGYLAEAGIALGNYPEAEESTGWMLKMLPQNTPALQIGARLRVLYGNPKGAIDFLNLAYSETSPTETEELAWIANQIASIEIDEGNTEAAAQMLDRAAQTFPGYVYTTENEARLKLAEHHAADAVVLWLQAAQLDPNPHILYELAKAQSAAGQQTEAAAILARFETLAIAAGNRNEDARRDLILMYAARQADSARALELARDLAVTRHDVWTQDALAWALYTNGKYQEAEIEIEKAIAVGILNAQIFDHAGHIELRLGHAEQASKDFTLAIRSNPLSEYAADARDADGKSATLAQVPSPQTVNTSPTRATLSGAPAVDVVAATLAKAEAAGPFPPVPAGLLTPKPTDTDRLIRNAQSNAARSSNDAVAYANLGAAHFQRARETGDVNDYQLAEDSLTKSLDIVSSDFSADEALETMSEVCMGEHRFNDALTYAHKALSLGSGDVSPFAIVGDAYADMGEYDKAAAAYARLTPRDMTLAPRAAYARDSRVSYLKFIAGDTKEAIRIMKIAVAEGVEAELPKENLAWLYYELGEYFTQGGDSTSADAAYFTTLTIHPGDYRALAALGKLLANHGRYAEAIVLYQSAIAVVPMPIFVAELGDLYARSGNQAEAKKQYQLVEYIGLLGHINQVLHNRDLALFYADHDIKLPEALDLAQKEFEVRHDVYTWDALAWALYKNGKFEEAAKASQSALKYGTRDALLLFHAGMISQHAGAHDQARSELKQALAINPQFHLLYADAARQSLAQLDAQTASNQNGDAHAR
jgi:tetratricopeptide (TPR) repeat protein